MSLLVIGVSHHSAPMALLERLEASDLVGTQLASAVVGAGVAREALVVSTCNRLEVYADVPAFHPAVAAIGEHLSAASGLDVDALTEHLYVRYDDRAVGHAFSVAAGLDSMAVGESQILGQLRSALHGAQRDGVAGEALNQLFQQALRVGKRVHTETDIDHHSTTLVQAALELAEHWVGPVAGHGVAVVGAGGMSGLAMATLARSGAREVVVVNRTIERARRLADRVSDLVPAHAEPWQDLAAVVANADIVITSTGARGQVLTSDLVRAAAHARGHAPQVLVDLAVPRDIAPAAQWQADTPGTRLVDLEGVGRFLDGRGDAEHVSAVRHLVDDEVAAYLSRRAQKSVAPTVAALRARAGEVVSAEMRRLDGRLRGVTAADRAEIDLAVHRIVEKLLHTPTKRIKEFGVDGIGAGGPDYAAVLRELFDLDPADVADVATPPRREVS